jgi:hypothetical protein
MSDRGDGRAADEAPLRDAVARKGSFAQSMKAVAWSFFGVRRRADHEKDLGQLNPVHVVIAGLIAVAVFIGVLVMVVHWVVGGAGAH